MDLLSAAVRANIYEDRFDLTEDGRLDADDCTWWIRHGCSSWYGDANLDGEFDSADFMQVLHVGKYETGDEASWAEGDWSGDGIFNSADFVIAFQDGGYELGPRMNATAVPEPARGRYS